MKIKRGNAMKQSLRHTLMASALAVATLFSGAALAQEEFGGQALIDAATKEGRLILYTSNQIEAEQELVKEFNKRFPKIRIELVRAPGSRLATRITSEFAANQLTADVIDMSDRGLVAEILPVFADYAPPNAADYPERVKAIANVWPKSTWGFVLAYNVAIDKEGPTTWAELADEKYKGRVGLVTANSGGSTWTAAMFQRKELGEGFWEKLAANNPMVYPSGSPLASGLVRGEVFVGAAQSNAVIPMAQQGAPLKVVFPEEGIPLTASAAGVTKTAKNPNAARLYMNWSLSPEGQQAWVKGQGGFSVLPAAGMPEGANENVKLWLPDAEEYVSVRNAWITEWNRIYKVQ
jgi:iron(III) transport system substrate-binding protein